MSLAVAAISQYHAIIIWIMVAAIPPYSSSSLADLDAINLTSFGSLCNIMPYPFCACKEVFESFCHNNYIMIREKKNSVTVTQKKSDGIKAQCPH